MGFIKNVGIGFVCASLLGTGAQAAGYVKFHSEGSRSFKVEKGESAFEGATPKQRGRNAPGKTPSLVEAGPQPEPPTRAGKRMRGGASRVSPKPVPATDSTGSHARSPSALGGARPDSSSRLGALTNGRRTAARPTTSGGGGCVDPVAENIVVSGVRANGDGTYDFSLRGSVVNRGSAGWASGMDQQIANLTQNGIAKAVARFPRLDAGARVNTSFARVRGWMPSQEFQAGFELRISYDPDIFMDGNERNDDCRMGNNLSSISVDEINREIARQAP
ncbi:MAG: hypothetical protein GY937_25645 [bacterium]|nr:hypothetical protein [bacterium]